MNLPIDAKDGVVIIRLTAQEAAELADDTRGLAEALGAEPSEVELALRWASDHCGGGR